MTDLNTRIQSWARENYTNSFAAQCAIECGEEYLNQLELESFEDWISFADALDERYTSTQEDFA